MKKCMSFLLIFMVVIAAVLPIGSSAVAAESNNSSGTTINDFFFTGDPPTVDLSNREPLIEWQNGEHKLIVALDNYHREIYYNSNLSVNFFVIGKDTESSAQENAEERLTVLEDTDDSVPDIVLLWLPEKTEDNVGIAMNEEAAKVITDEDIEDIKNSVNIGEEYSSYQQAVNLLKAVIVAIFNGGEFAYPQYSYINEFLSDPDKIETEGPTGMTSFQCYVNDEQQQAYYEIDEDKQMEILYILKTICTNTGTSPIIMLDAYKDNVLETQDEYAETVGIDPENALYIFYNADNGGYTVDFTAGENVGLSEEQQAEIAEAFAEGEDNYTHMINGTVALAEALFENRGLELPASFSDEAEGTDSNVTTVVIIAVAAVIVVAAAVVAVVLVKKKKHS